MEIFLLKLDIYTLMLLALFGYLLGFLTLSLTWMTHRDMPGTGLWWLGSLLAVIGQSGFAMQLLTTSAVGLWVGNVFLITHVALMVASLRRFFALPPAWRVWWGAVLAFAVLMAWAFYVELAVSVRIVLSSLAFLAWGSTSVWLLWQHGREDSPLASRLFMAVMALIMALTLLRMGLLSVETVGSPFRRQLVNVIPYISMLVGGYLSSIGFLLLCTERRNMMLRELALRDALTGVFNRRGLHHELGRQLTNEPMMLAMLDLDDFKLINDCFGHDTGDRVLQSVAQTLSQQPGLLVGRFGGEEFVLLAQRPDGKAAALCQHLCRAIADMRIDGLPITASIGMDWLQPGETLDEALRRADKALYQAKLSGKNRVCEWTADLPDVTRASGMAMPWSSP